jgi:hypothetical protein
MSFSATERGVSFRFPLALSAALELEEACFNGFVRLSGFALSGLTAGLSSLSLSPSDGVVEDEATVGLEMN